MENAQATMHNYFGNLVSMIERGREGRGKGNRPRQKCLVASHKVCVSILMKSPHYRRFRIISNQEASNSQYIMDKKFDSRLTQLLHNATIQNLRGAS